MYEADKAEMLIEVEAANWSPPSASLKLLPRSPRGSWRAGLLPAGMQVLHVDHLRVCFRTQCEKHWYALTFSFIDKEIEAWGEVIFTMGKN